MIWKPDEATPTWREGLQKGNGGAWCSYMVSAGQKRPGSRFRMVGRIALDPGASIGPHTHAEDEEIYVILSGFGRYMDGTEARNVGPGDITLTHRGESHALENTGSEPLVILAIIAEQES